MRGLGLAVCLLLCCSLARGQSLVDLAKQEKERRKANAEAGKKASLDAEGGPKREERKPKDKERLPTRQELIRELEQEAEELARARDRKVKECREEMDFRGYREMSDNLVPCREMKEIHAKRNELLKTIDDLRKKR
jgi:uncharacterized protein (DUF488 family)